MTHGTPPELLETTARDAVRKPDDFRQRLQAAAVAVGKLADRLNGAEPDFDRVRRDPHIAGSHGKRRGRIRGSHPARMCRLKHHDN